MKKIINIILFVLVLAATAAFTKENRCGEVYFGTPHAGQNAYECTNEYHDLVYAAGGELYFYALTRRWDNTLVLKSDLAPGQSIVSYISANGGSFEFECKDASFNSCF